MTKTKAVSTQVNEESLALLKESYPVEQGFQRTILPRLSMLSQDKTEGKGKAMKVVAEAGTFFIERETDEMNEEGKKIWEKTELGSEIEATVFYKRKQLRFFDEATEEYTSSPIYDNDDEVVPLFCNKTEVARGTPAELKAKYEYVSEDGKKKSRLEDNRILYVLYKDEIFQLNLRGSSMYSFKTYERNALVPACLTKMSSESKEKGTIAWNQMTFTTVRPLDQEEVDKIVELVKQMRESIIAEKAFFASQNAKTSTEDDSFRKAGF